MKRDADARRHRSMLRDLGISPREMVKDLTGFDGGDGSDDGSDNLDGDVDDMGHDFTATGTKAWAWVDEDHSPRRGMLQRVKSMDAGTYAEKYAQEMADRMQFGDGVMAMMAKNEAYARVRGREEFESIPGEDFLSA